MGAHTFRTARTSLKCGSMALALGTVILALVGSPLATAEPGRITTLALSPQDGTLWVGTTQGLFQSGDQGRTLTPVTLPGAAPSGEVTAVAEAPASSKAVYVATAGQGIFRSEDGGRTWAAANQGLDALDVRGLTLSRGPDPRGPGGGPDGRGDRDPELLPWSYRAERFKGQGAEKNRGSSTVCELQGSPRQPLVLAET